MKRPLLFLMLFFISIYFSTADGAILQKGMGENQCLESNTIHVGDNVVWINYFDRSYQVTSVDAFDHLDGIFDSGIIPSMGVYSYLFDQPGDYFYFCSVPHQGHGLIKVLEGNSLAEIDPVSFPKHDGPILTSKSTDGSLIANLVSDTPQMGKILPIRLFFTGKYGEYLSDVNFAIIASQNGSLVPINFDDIQPDGKADYNVGPLISDDKLIVQLKIFGLGHPQELNYINLSGNDVITLQTKANVKELSPLELIKDKKIPDWFRIVLSWYDQKLITEEEVLNGFKFLVDKNIIKS